MSSSETLYRGQPQSTSGIVLPFVRPKETEAKPHACIFCGKTIRVHKFRGKTVCFSCLQHIPSLFAL